MAKKKILIVDDEQSITKLLKFMLEKTGVYEVSCLNEGLKVLSTIRTAAPDLLILDLNMPDISGAEISAAIKDDSSLGHIPIVYLTGNVSREEVDSGLSIGGHPAMAKPIDVEKLLQCLEKNLK